MMRDTIVIHCSATRAGHDVTAAVIDAWHRDRGFWSIGYHYVIRLDGSIEAGRDVTLTSRAHCMGWNAYYRHLLRGRTQRGGSAVRHTHSAAEGGIAQIGKTTPH